ncbi:PLASTID MOVEMENT IMPAIRED PROTEIN-RELATED [Salix purpurea]|uniref:PLASTID MOVEMENT IMPAIRED PROTEIN-RELATED n=1 Tax=Salix purpurea TaxID=77065 RepID=A0A9Q0WG92_SALPP|nr:PLASTID MOVEMENT IMPAIRED PROTEIN-RELATED [Salix purpurea]
MEQYLRVSDGKASPKRSFRALLRGRNHRSLKSNLPEPIGQINGGCVVSHTNENGFVRMKVVVRKQDLKQMLEVMRGGRSNDNRASNSPVSSLSLEQHFNLLRRKHLSRSNSAKGSCRRSWTPALQSIPE